MRRKYHNKKVTLGDMTFDSKKEANRWVELAIMQKNGEITDLDTQVVFELIPAQRDPVTKKVLERAVHYVADFVYYRGNEKVVEDTKGYRTPEYILKRKMLLWVHGIRIKEV